MWVTHGSEDSWTALKAMNDMEEVFMDIQLLTRARRVPEGESEKWEAKSRGSGLVYTCTP